MNTFKKGLFALAVMGLLLPVPLYSVRATETETSSSKAAECRLAMKTAKATFKSDMKAIEKMYNDSIMSAYQTYKVSARTSADLAVLLAAKKAARETLKTYEVAATAKLAAATVGKCVTSSKKENAKLVKACVKDVKSETKAAIKAAKATFKADKEDGMTREELKAARKTLQASIETAKDAEKDARDACKTKTTDDSDEDQTSEESDSDDETEVEDSNHRS